MADRKVLFRSGGGFNESAAADNILAAGIKTSAGAITLDAGGANSVILRSNGATVLVANSSAQILPASDNIGSIGIVGTRWSLVRAVTITSGDLNLFDEEREAMWTLREEPDCIVAINQMTGKKYKLMLQEVDE